MKLLLNFFDADWGYVALLENDGKMVSSLCEVMSSWMIVDYQPGVGSRFWLPI